jgi:hypothetical protein
MSCGPVALPPAFCPAPRGREAAHVRALAAGPRVDPGDPARRPVALRSAASGFGMHLPRRRARPPPRTARRPGRPSARAGWRGRARRRPAPARRRRPPSRRRGAVPSATAANTRRRDRENGVDGMRISSGRTDRRGPYRDNNTNPIDFDRLHGCVTEEPPPRGHPGDPPAAHRRRAVRRTAPCRPPEHAGRRPRRDGLPRVAAIAAEALGGAVVLPLPALQVAAAAPHRGDPRVRRSDATSPTTPSTAPPRCRPASSRRSRSSRAAGRWARSSSSAPAPPQAPAADVLNLAAMNRRGAGDGAGRGRRAGASGGDRRHPHGRRRLGRELLARRSGSARTSATAR